MSAYNHWYRVAKTHRMPWLYRSFPAYEPCSYWLFCGKGSATWGSLCIVATLYAWGYNYSMHDMSVTQLIHMCVHMNMCIHMNISYEYTYRCVTCLIHMCARMTWCHAHVCVCMWYIRLTNVCVYSYDLFICIHMYVYAGDMFVTHMYVYSYDMFICIQTTCAWFGSSICVYTWICVCTRTYHMSTHTCAWLFSFICSYVFICVHTYGSVCVTCRFDMCDVTTSYVWHGTRIREACLIPMCDMTHSYAWRDDLLFATWHLLCAIKMSRTNKDVPHRDIFIRWRRCVAQRHLHRDKVPHLLRDIKMSCTNKDVAVSHSEGVTPCRARIKARCRLRLGVWGSGIWGDELSVPRCVRVE